MKIIMITICIGLGMIYLALVQYNRAVTNNLWFAELQDTKKHAIICEREAGQQVWVEIQKEQIETKKNSQ